MVGNNGTSIFNLVLVWSWSSLLVSSFSPSGFAFVWPYFVQCHNSLHLLFANTKCNSHSAVAISFVFLNTTANLLCQRASLALADLIVRTGADKSKNCGNEDIGKMWKFFPNKLE